MKLVFRLQHNKMFDRDERIFLEPGINFTLRWVIYNWLSTCHYYNILRNIITAFDGRTNISVVCMAKVTDVPVLSVT